jgi:cytochrome c peroxidase
MMTKRIWILAALATAACSGDRSAPTSHPEISAKAPEGSRAGAVSDELSPRLLRRFRALDAVSVDGPPDPRVRLGRLLYYDTRLSTSGTVACQTCHPLERYGATGDAVSIGVKGQHGSRNAPSTYHAAGHFRQFWDGRVATIDEQAKGPIINPSEMGMTPEAVVATLANIPAYREEFERAFPGEDRPITFDNVSKAIAAFERGLITPGRWDLYLRGDTNALTPKEKEGAKLFANLGCMVCHTGEYIGGSMMEKVGVQVPWPNQKDRGRANVTGSPADAMVFKVPSLRNVARTAPYFHDGSVNTLDEAVRMMALHQLGLELADDEVSAMVAWLGSLTGDIPHAYIARPTPVADAR